MNPTTMFCKFCSSAGLHDVQMTVMGSGLNAAKYWQCQKNEFHREPFGIAKKRDENEVFDSERDKAIPNLP